MIPNSRVVVATGEATGHSHVAEGLSVSGYTPNGDVSSLSISAPSGAEVLHEEHKPITLPPGEYDRIIVNEYDHFLEESREVMD